MGLTKRTYNDVYMNDEADKYHSLPVYGDALIILRLCRQHKILSEAYKSEVGSTKLESIVEYLATSRYEIEVTDEQVKRLIELYLSDTVEFPRIQQNNFRDYHKKANTRKERVYYK